MTTSSSPAKRAAPPRPPAPRPKTQITIGCVAIPILVAVILVGAYVLVRLNATNQLVIPGSEVALVRAAPDESAPLMARVGQGRTLTITGRSDDWRWLEVELWDNQRGWTLRPLDILVWQLDAPVATPTAPASAPVIPPPVAEDMIAIPATTFTMGSPPGLGNADESPAHPVSLSAFEIDRTEVTLGHYWQCVQAKACAAPINDAAGSEPHYASTPSFDNHPVVHIPWGEANNYCQWRGKRLPTEAEWELVAGWDVQKNAKSMWPWGNTADGGVSNVGDASPGQAAVVGTFPTDKSPVGALDMAGNVSEWVFDWYKADYYSVADDTDPVGPSHRRGEGTGRVVRGGSYADSSMENARTANRRHQAESYGYPAIGFRCAR